MGIARREFLLGAGAAIAAGALADDAPSSNFTTANNGKQLTVLAQGMPVLVYNYAPVDPPEGVAEKFRRGNYLHPVYSPDGSVITEDFPKDHYHHRGIFWAWPNCQVKGRKLNVWELDGARPVFHEFLILDGTQDRFHLQSRSVWQFDDDGFAPIEEQAGITVHPSNGNSRAFDFELNFKNVADADVVFQGSPASAGEAGRGAKGYGGFCYRPDAANKPFTFSAAEGVVKEDRMYCETPWVDISWGEKRAGVTITQHLDNPGYPHPGWIIRHYGFLGASWPHTATHTLRPGESFTLRYTVTVRDSKT